MVIIHVVNACFKEIKHYVTMCSNLEHNERQELFCDFKTKTF